MHATMFTLWRWFRALFQCDQCVGMMSMRKVASGIVAAGSTSAATCNGALHSRAMSRKACSVFRRLSTWGVRSPHAQLVQRFAVLCLNMLPKGSCSEVDSAVWAGNAATFPIAGSLAPLCSPFVRRRGQSTTDAAGGCRPQLWSLLHSFAGLFARMTPPGVGSPFGATHHCEQRQVHRQRRMPPIGLLPSCRDHRVHCHHRQ